MFSDLRHAVRGLLRTPGFTAATVLSLALGIGGNVLMFGRPTVSYCTRFHIPIPVDSSRSASGRDAYIPFLQSPQARMRIFVRSRLNQATLVPVIRQEVTQLDSSLPLSEIKTMEERVGDAMWRTRVAAWLFSAFAGLALLLTAIGIFGVMSQTVSQRTPEIGVRMALGAKGSDVLGLVLGRASVLTGVGIAAGVAIALGLTRAMTALLYETEPGDPLTLGNVAAVLGVVAMAACYLPARRAARVDPLVALRYE